MKKFKVVILECPYDSFSDPFCQKMFSKIVKLKFDGYRAEYPYGVLPVDGTDFVSTHHVICEIENSDLRPVMAYKTITLHRIQTHHLNFPLINMTKQFNLKSHEKRVADIIEQATISKARLCYDSSWTIDPSVRKDREKTKLLREMMTAIHCLYHQTYKTDIILSLGSLRFKMDKLFTYWGYEAIKLNGIELPSFEVPTYFNEPVKIFHMHQGFSDEAKVDSDKHLALWNDRITIFEEKPDLNRSRPTAA